MCEFVPKTGGMNINRDGVWRITQNNHRRLKFAMEVPHCVLGHPGVNLGSVNFRGHGDWSVNLYL